MKHQHEKISRKEAKSQGLIYYYTMRSCINNHYALRFVCNGHCVECVKQNRKKWGGTKKVKKKRAIDAKRNRQMIANLNCEFCGSDKNLGWHHSIPRASRAGRRAGDQGDIRCCRECNGTLGSAHFAFRDACDFLIRRYIRKYQHKPVSHSIHIRIAHLKRLVLDPIGEENT